MKRSMGILVLIVILITTSVNVCGATGYAVSNYQFNDYQEGAFHNIAAVVGTHLNNMGYNSGHTYNSAQTIRAFLSGNNTKVYYLAGHSGACFQGCEPGGLTRTLSGGQNAMLQGLNNLTMVKLMYFSGCSTGAYSGAQGGYLDAYAITLGVDATIAFQSTIYFTGLPLTGCHYFDNRAFYYMRQGYSVGSAANNAKYDLLSQGLGSFGTDSIFIIGSGTYIN